MWGGGYTGTPGRETNQSDKSLDIREDFENNCKIIVYST